MQLTVPLPKSTSFRIPSIERSCDQRYNTNSDSAAGNPPCVSRPVCLGQESRKSEREGWRAVCGTQSCQQPLTYTWHPRDGLSIDLSSPSHLISMTSARSFSLLLSAPLSQQTGWAQHFKMAGHHMTFTSPSVWTPRSSPSISNTPKGITAFQLLISRMSDWLNETLKNGIYLGGLWGEREATLSILSTRSM